MLRVSVFLYFRAEAVLNGFKVGTRAARYPDWATVVALVVQTYPYYWR